MERNSSLDIIRGLGCFLIIYIHSSINLETNLGADYILAFARIAVPLFFMISGYFYPYTLSRGKEHTYLKKILFITTLSTVLYAILPFYNHDINASRIVNWIVFNATPTGGWHLWFLFALIYIIVIYNYFKDFLTKYAIHLAIFFILVNYLLSFGNPLYYRNFLFTGLPYFLIGTTFYNRRNTLIIPKVRVSYILILILLLDVELYIYKYFDIVPIRDHYLMTFPLTLVIFSYALTNHNVKKGNLISYIGNHYSLYIYVLHPIFMTLTIYFVNNFLGNDILRLIENNYFFPILLIPISCIATFALGKMYKLVKRITNRN